LYVLLKQKQTKIIIIMIVIISFSSNYCWFLNR